MDENEEIRVSLSIFLLVLSVIIMIIMGVFLYRFYNEKVDANKKVEELQKEVETLEKTIDNLQAKLDKLTGASDNIVINNTSNIKYKITIRDDNHATIEATDDENTVSEEFELDAEIDKTGTMTIPNLGNVALISYTSGKTRIVNIYQLVDGGIKLLGDIDCGKNMVEEADYTVDIKNNNIAVITAKRYDETVTSEFKMSTTIDNTNIIDIFDYGKVVLIAQSDGSNYSIQMYRLAQDYDTNRTQGIINVCDIQYGI